MTELSKTFQPDLIENKWYSFWEKEGLFTADTSSSKPPYCILMPPPNVTGVLHMGHALVNTLQDVLIRWKRMSGFEALWIPGTDHAGIATQTVVERKLIEQTGKRRIDFPREEFLSHVWDWKEKSQSSILNQMQRLGISCDWSRMFFTLDETRSASVKEAFKKLFDKGLIYRGDYLVNWDPVTETALADDEVEHEEKESFLWHFSYPLADGSGSITIATTRPETMLGDTAVAVAPGDKRYEALIGKKLKLPLMNREIPIIEDRHVDPSFGSGAVKITPAHDPNDYEMGLRHDLPFINMMTPNGKINENGGSFAGLSIEDARDAVVNAMKDLGFLAKVEPHTNRVGISYRSKAPIQPLLSKQWFVKTSAFKKELRKLVEEKKVKLIPENWENTYFHWIDNLRDWCISRQLWWGHRIPIWYNVDDQEKVICYDGKGLPPEVAANPESWRQEEDVLDTWFSSALLPFSALTKEERKKFYPNSTLITGHDILFFWVARMILMGSSIMDEVPFTETFLHGLIYGKSYWKMDETGAAKYIQGKEKESYDMGGPLASGVQFKWEKMSKSKGNVINPIEMIDLYGTDAIRMALCASATQARQIDLDRRRFEEFKNFANKVWNGARFVFMNLETLTKESFAEGLDEALFTLEDRWILSKLSEAIQGTNDYLQEYQFDKAALCAYDFFWKELCAYYVEMSKPFLTEKVGTPAVKENKQKLLAIILSSSLRLLHPMVPFITEELFSLLQEKFTCEGATPKDLYTQECLKAFAASSCMKALYPSVLRKEDKDIEVEKSFALMSDLLHAIRNIRAEMQIPPATPVEVSIFAENENDPLLLTAEKNKNMLDALVKISSLEIGPKKEEPLFCAKKGVESLTVLIPLPEELKEKELARLKKEQTKLEGQLSSLEKRFKNKEFLEKAPQEVLEKLKGQRDKVKSALEAIYAKVN